MKEEDRFGRMYLFAASDGAYVSNMRFEHAFLSGVFCFQEDGNSTSQPTDKKERRNETLYNSRQ
jgi:hypothetical protein